MRKCARLETYHKKRHRCGRECSTREMLLALACTASSKGLSYQLTFPAPSPLSAPLGTAPSKMCSSYQSAGGDAVALHALRASPVTCSHTHTQTHTGLQGTQQEMPHWRSQACAREVASRRVGLQHVAARLPSRLRGSNGQGSTHIRRLPAAPRCRRADAMRHQHARAP